MNQYRSHNLSEISEKLVGKNIKIAGWIDTIRDHGGITFVVIRDQYASLQAVFSDASVLKGLLRETVVSIEGTLLNRADDVINDKIALGKFEIKSNNMVVLGRCYESIPFEIAESKNVKDEIRLKYRFLDIRNKEVAKNLLFRSKVTKSIRDKMFDLGFYEFNTPILTSSSPEGARDFLVPSRLHQGKFYALPQAPQQFKQLLMASGIDRYFQIAPCFRDEDGRADRTPGEFYQFDLEMAFATQEDVFQVAENVLSEIFKEYGSKKFDKAPFNRIPFLESMERFGSDKPDLRNPLEITDLTDIFANTKFNAFTGSVVKGLAVKTGEVPRSFYDTLTQFIVDAGAKGLVWFKTDENNKLVGPVTKFLSDEEMNSITRKLNVKAGDSVFLLASKKLLEVQKLSGQLRNELGNRLNLIDKSKHNFCWIVDFPMYEINEETKQLDFMHNPFSMPQGGLDALLNQDPLSILAYQYDLVCDGYELASGAVRNHEPELMVKAFELAGYSEETVLSKFPAMYNAFKFGAPPHAGMAPGIERLIMILTGEINIKEVIAFPLTKNGLDLLMNAPSEVTEKQLREVHIKIRESRN